MTNNLMEPQLRETIIANPDVLLQDHDVMRALVASNDQAQGNVIDLRAIAMERLEARFDKLEDTHRNVVAAAYDNLAGTNQIHRALLALLNTAQLTDFLEVLSTDVTDILRVDAIHMIIESDSPDDQTPPHAAITNAPTGFVTQYITQGRNTPVRKVTLRTLAPSDDRLQSEACLTIDLGPDQPAAMIIMAASDAQQFTPQQGTDLLTFFTSAVERLLQRLML